MSTIDDMHLAGLITFPILAVGAIILIWIRAARGESLFRVLLSHPNAFLDPRSVFRDDSMKEHGLVHVPVFISKWRRYRALYMGLIAYLIVMTFYYASLYYDEGVFLRPTGELVDLGRWIAYTLVALIAMCSMTILLYVEKEQAFFVRLFGTIAPASLYFATRAVTDEGIIIMFVFAAIATAIAFIYLVPTNYITHHRYRRKWRAKANKYAIFGFSLLFAYMLVGLAYLLACNHRLTNALTPSGEAIMNYIVDVVIAVYFYVMINVKFFASDVVVFEGALTENHIMPATDKIDDAAEKVPLFPVIAGGNSIVVGPPAAPAAASIRQRPSRSIKLSSPSRFL